MCKAPTRLNVSDLIDRSDMGVFQITTLIICSLCLVMDGFNVQALGYIAPALAQDWNIPASALGPVFGVTNFGFLIGSLSFGMMADKIGRRPVLIGSTLFYSATTILSAGATSLQELLTLRFIAGIGLGPILPNATALISEYSPRRRRIPLMILAGVGFTCGAGLSGFVSALLIPYFGWRSVFYVGGTLPLILAVVMFLRLPESIQLLVLQRRSADRIGRWLRHIDPAAVGDHVEYVVEEETKVGIPATQLVRDGRVAVTILLWIVNFTNLLSMYFLWNWVPTVMRGAGYSTSSAVLIGSLLQVGGVTGTFLSAWLVSRVGFIPLLTSSFVVCSITIGLIGQPGLSAIMLVAGVFVAGWCVSGNQNTINALSATSYPTWLRSTGIGWALGIGRIGAIIGPVVGGELIRRQWSTNEIFMAAAVPALFSAAATLSLRRPVTSAATKQPQATIPDFSGRKQNV